MPKLSKQQVYKNVEEAFLSVGIKTQTEMGKVCHCYQETVSKWKNGINYPTMDHMLDVSVKTKYSIQWLFSREGPKLVSIKTNSKEAVVMATLHSLSKADHDWVVRWIEEKGRK